MTSNKIYLWDFPTRAFHWLLVCAIVAAFITGKLGGNLILWHCRIGYFILGLIVFRLIWGFIGATPSRFAYFIRGPKTIIDYMKGRWTGIGHNPLGALSVVAFLILIGFQVGSGLFANDDIAFSGPFAVLVSKDTSHFLTGLHRQVVNLLLALVVLHILSIIFYAIGKKRNLVRPMITGWQKDAPSNAPPIRRGSLVAFIVAALIATALAWSVGSGYITDQLASPPPPDTEQPAAPAW